MKAPAPLQCTKWEKSLMTLTHMGHFFFAPTALTLCTRKILWLRLRHGALKPQAAVNSERMEFCLALPEDWSCQVLQSLHLEVPYQNDGEKNSTYITGLL
jgi:hypothetical protein